MRRLLPLSLLLVIPAGLVACSSSNDNAAPNSGAPVIPSTQSPAAANAYCAAVRSGADLEKEAVTKATPPDAAARFQAALTAARSQAPPELVAAYNNTFTGADKDNALKTINAYNKQVCGVDFDELPRFGN